MSVQEKKFNVTFLYSRKFHYALPLFLFICVIYGGIREFINISSFYYILFVICSLPIFLISLKSKIRKYQLEIMNEKLVIGPITISKNSLQKIVIYQPVTIYFHLNRVKKKKSIEAIQSEKEDADHLILEIMKWAKINDIEFERHY